MAGQVFEDELMERISEGYTTARTRSNTQPQKLGDILEELLNEMFTAAEYRAGEMRGAVRPEQRNASRDLDLLAEIAGTE